MPGFISIDSNLQSVMGGFLYSLHYCFIYVRKQGSWQRAGLTLKSPSKVHASIIAQAMCLRKRTPLTLILATVRTSLTLFWWHLDRRRRSICVRDLCCFSNVVSFKVVRHVTSKVARQSIPVTFPKIPQMAAYTPH